MSLEKFDERQPYSDLVTILPGNGVNPVTSNSPAGNGGRIDTIVATTDDTAANVLIVTYSGPQGNGRLGNVAVPALAGSGVVAAVDVLALLATSLQSGLILGPNDSLRFNVETAVTAGKQLTIQMNGGTF